MNGVWQLDGKKLFGITCLLILAIAFFFAEHSNIHTLMVFLLIQVGLSIVALKLAGYKFLSLAVLFEVFLSIFHCGQVILELFEIEADRAFDVFFLVDDATLKDSFVFYFWAHFFLTIGLILPKIKKRELQITNNSNDGNSEDNDLRVVYVTGRMLFWIGIIPRLYIDISQLSIFLSAGYLKTYAFVVNSYVQIIAYCFQIGLLLMLIGSQKKKNTAKTITLFAVLYSAITMIRGGRATQVVFLIALLFIYIRIIEKISFKKTIKYLVIGYLGLVFVDIIGNARSLGTEGYLNAIKSIGSSFSLQMVWDSLGEFGSTAISMCYALKYFPSMASFTYGLPYISSFLFLLPNIGGWYNNLQNEWIFIYKLPKDIRYSLGGSFLGELYSNFGFGAGILAAMFIGIFISIISNKIDSSIEDRRWKTTAYYVVTISPILIWVRSYFANGLRQIIWIQLFIYIIMNIVERRKLK